jgi:hypothetical protein
MPPVRDLETTPGDTSATTPGDPGPPRGLKPFLCHGVDLDWGPGAAQATGACPFCGKPKLYVALDTSKWDCKVCSPEGGNDLTFLRLLWERSGTLTTPADYEALRVDRGYLGVECLRRWGLVKSFLTGEWLVPGYSPEGEVCNLYRWAVDPKKEVRRLWPTTGREHCLMGLGAWDPKKPRVAICEGPWDGMALWELMKRVAKGPRSKASMAEDMNVLAVPSAGTFKEAWGALFRGKEVTLLYDNDHPRPGPSGPAAGGRAGYVGMQRAAGVLGAMTPPPKSVAYLAWGPEGYAPGLPSGTDVRDWLHAAPDVAGRAGQLNALWDMVQPCPAPWLASARPQGAPSLEPLACSSWAAVEAAWERAMRFTPHLRATLLCMLASAASTECVGEQLWVLVLGPPSCGKTTLCEGLSCAREWVYPKDTLTGLVTGYQIDRDGSENLSLALKLKNKTLVINDGDTILQLPNRAQVFSQLRAFYSRNLRTQYGNKMSGDMENISATVIICGTGSLRQLDMSEFGERFIIVRAAGPMTAEEERGVSMRAALQEAAGMGQRFNGRADSTDSPEKIQAKRLTGGYVCWLRENVFSELAKIAAPPDAVGQCVDLGTLVAYLRARQSKTQDEETEREMPHRLARQMVRLAKCLAVVMNRPALDAEVMGLCKRVALDTAKGKTLAIARALASAGAGGLQAGTVARLINRPDDEVGKLLRFMTVIGALQRWQAPSVGGVKAAIRYKLSPRLDDLYRRIIQPQGDNSDAAGQR